MKKNSGAILLVIAFFLILVALNFFFFVETGAPKEDERTGSRSSYSSTPYGTLAYYTLLEENGYPVIRLKVPFTDLKKHPEIDTLIMISVPNQSNPEADEYKSLTEWVEAGGRLIIIDREIVLDFDQAQVATQWGGFKTDVRPMQPSLLTLGVKNIELTEYATRLKIENGSVTYHLGYDEGVVLADMNLGEGRIVMLTEPFIVANNGISHADNVTLALNLVAGGGGGEIAFDEYHHGYGASSSGGLMDYFRGTPVPWMMAQAGLMILLIVYTYGRRFTRPIPLRRERRTTNLEFVSSMGNIAMLANATDLAMQGIYTEFRKRLCRYCGLPSKVETSKLAATAARRSTVDERVLRDLLMRCERVERGAPTGDAELLRLVSRIREIETALKL